jgi:hypothetical protein
MVEFVGMFTNLERFHGLRCRRALLLTWLGALLTIFGLALLPPLMRAIPISGTRAG